MKVRTFLKMRNPRTTRKELHEVGISNITGYLFRIARTNAGRLREFGYNMPIMKLYESHPFARHVKKEFDRRNK